MKKEINNYMDIYDYYISQIEMKTELNRNIIFVIFLISEISFLFGYYDMLISYIITLYYPIKWSIEDIKKRHENYYKLWTSYWIIFCIFFIMDLFHYWILQLFPLYFFIKTYTLLWIYLPCFNGGIIIYDIIFYQIIKYFQSKIYLVENSNTLLDLVKKHIANKKKKV